MARKPQRDVQATADLSIETLGGDIRDWLIGRMRTQPRTWAMLSQDEQSNLYEDADRASVNLVRKVVTMVAAHDFPKIAIHLNKFTVKDGTAKAEIEAAASHDNIIGLAGAGACILVLASADAFAAARGEPDIDPDQPGMFEAAAE